ncbi:MAG: hypothetical protein HYZ45_06950 [Burkholderiales bacterium]|nr:hypothetical protein [Burkholderiales bacterium]
MSLEGEVLIGAYWIAGNCAFRASEFERALQIALIQKAFERSRGKEYEVVLAISLQ